MKHLNTVEDIIMDPTFRKWVLHDDAKAKEIWLDYMSEHPEKKDMVDMARSLLLEFPNIRYRMSDQALSSTWKNIEQSLGTSETPSQTYQEKRFKVQPYWYYLAASFAGILLVASFWFYSESQSLLIYRTAYGETRQLTLPDSSTVILNANSTFRYDENEFLHERIVWVEGEAFFDINKQVSSEGILADFRVVTEALSVEVLGTEFNVNTRRNNTKVVLAEGKVKLQLVAEETPKESIIMSPGEMVIYETGGGITKNIVELQTQIAWKQGKLVFEDTPVKEIIHLLEDNYGLKIKLQNKEIAERRYTGTFQKPEPEIILLSLQTLFNLQKELHKDKIILK